MSTPQDTRAAEVPADGTGPGACPSFVAAMDIVGRRWNGRVVQALGAGCKGFAEIARHVDGVSDQVLARRLRELESDGLIRRSVTNGRPPAARYFLTDTGRTLLPVLDALTEWGRQLLNATEAERHEEEDPETADLRAELDAMAEWGRQDIVVNQTRGTTRPPKPDLAAPRATRRAHRNNTTTEMNDSTPRTEQDR
ncbi:MAG: winged helix-turn-helix transcriptional regulator [Pauljensenia sp.]